MTRRVSIVALDGAIATYLMGIMDLFRITSLIAKRVNGTEKALFDVQLVSEQGNSVTCSNGCQITVNGDLSCVQAQDLLIIPAFIVSGRGDLEQAIAGWQSIIPWLQQISSQVDTIATHCSGGFLLAEAGLLEGKRATTSWWLSDTLSTKYPNIQVDTNSICVQSGNIVTGAASISYLDVCLAMIEKYAGKHFARLVAKYMMIDSQRQSQAPYTILSLFESNDPMVNQAEQWIRANLSRDFRIEELANEVAVSPRTLIRRFQRAVGESPQSFIQKLRIEKCKALLETTKLPFTKIVSRCGYSDESAFRRLFKRLCQLPPGEYRQRFSTFD